MATPIAEAFILVKPDVSSFASELKKGLGTQLDVLKQNPPKIPVALNLTQKEIQRVQKQIRDAGLVVPVTPAIVEAGRAVRAGAASAAEAASTTATVAIDPNTTDFQSKLQTAVTSAASKVKASVSVGLVIATGARDKLRDQIKAIPGAVIPVTPVISGRPPAAPPPAGAPPGAPPPPPAAGGGGAGRAADDLSQSARVAAESSAALEGALVRARVAAQNVAIAEELAANEALDLAQAQAALKVATDAANQSAKAGVAVQVQAAKLQGEGAEQASRAAGATAAAGESARQTLQERVNLLQEAQAAEDQAAAARQKAADETQRSADKVAASQQKQADLGRVVAAAEQSIARDAELAAKGQLDLEVAGDRVTEMRRIATRVSNEYTRALIEGDAEIIKGAEALQEQQAANVAAARSQREGISIIQERARLENELIAAREAGAAQDTEVQRTQARERAQVSLQEQARKLATRAQNEGNKAARDSIIVLEKLAAAEVKESKRLNLLATADEQRLRNRERGLRGAVAAGLSFLGLRAQVLAASSAFIAGATAVTAFGAAVRSAVQLETQLAVFGETVGATSEQIEQVAELSRELGRDITLPGVGAGDAAAAMTELAKAGLSVQDSMTGARGTLQLATVAGISTAEAAQSVAGALNAFGLAGEEATRIADLFVNAANASQASLQDMQAAFAQVNAVAFQVGLTVQDTTALLTLMAQAGLKGSDAGTSLRTALLRLVSPTQEAAKVIESLGLNIRDAAGNVRPEVFAEFGSLTRDLGRDVQDAAASIIFGQDAIRAVAIASREGEEGLRAAQTEMQNLGSAAALTEAQTSGLAGSASALASNLETLGGTIGHIASGPIKGLVDGVNDLVTLLNLGADVAGDMFVKIEEEAPFAAKALDTVWEAAKRATFILPALASAAAKGLAPETKEDRITKAVADIEDFNRRVVRLQAIFEGVGFPVESLKRQQEQIQNTINQLQVGIEVDEPIIPLTPIETAAEALRGMIATARELKLPTGGLQAQLKDVEERIKLTQGAVGRLGREGVPDALALDAVSERINNKLREIRANAEHLDPLDPLFESASQAVDNAVREIQSLGPRGAAAAQEASRILAPALDKSIRSLIEEATGVSGLVEPVISEELKRAIEVAGLSPEGRARLKRIGNEFTELIGEGIEENDKAVRAAREALNEAIEQGEEDVRQAIESARGNLESLGDTLADQVSQIIDNMDFGVPRLQRQTLRIELESDVREAERALRDAQQSGLSGQALAPFTQNVADAKAVLADFSKSGKASLDTLQDALQGLQDRLQKRQLQFGLRTAQRELRDAQQSIGALTRRGGLNEDQQRAISEALDPFRENVAQAKGELRTFDLSTQIKALQEIQEKAKKAATEGISKLVDDFQKGRISAGRFEKELRTLLGPQLDALKKKAGTNLGLSFTQNFLRTFKTLVTQAQLLTGFLDVLGTEPGPKAEDPRKAQTAAQKARQQAAENLREAISAQKKTAQNSDSQVRLLALILATLANQPGTPVTDREIRNQQARAQALTGLRGLNSE